MAIGPWSPPMGVKQKIRPDIRILAVSGMAWDKAIAKGESATVKAFLQKPFTAEKLLRTVAEVLASEGPKSY